MAKEEILLDIEEVLKRVPITRRSLYNFWEREEGPRRTFIGTRVFVTESDLNAWIYSRKEQTGQAEGE